MNMFVSGGVESSAAMYTRFMQLNKAGLAGRGPTGFGHVLAQAYSRNVTSGLSGLYGVSVGVESIPKDEREISNRGRNGELKDVMIPPSVAEKMQSDPALRAKVEGSIYHYIHVERPDFIRTDQLYGIKTVGSSLIIHEDGTWTIWSASVTSPEEVEKGRKLEAEKLKRRAGERQLEELRGSSAWLGMTAQMPFMTSDVPGNAWFSQDMNSNTYLALLQKMIEAKALQRYYATSSISSRGGFHL
ncbi:hypothetical protein FE784_00035 [Paenibacillus hemerocallicola]|uniref:Uncharacterized protein n=1 Tax=Paenibacillus hemerocallicola TaxID=1172614 RepID=A0A5C4TG74_9BACL|nr:hypothetical protein [Paenibacillus hemerocallicola]TNJ68093.1 hypothetical protein FE784_00035 [Paenibacillus hemerocallicola]